MPQFLLAVLFGLGAALLPVAEAQRSGGGFGGRSSSSSSSSSSRSSGGYSSGRSYSGGGGFYPVPMGGPTVYVNSGGGGDGGGVGLLIFIAMTGIVLASMAKTLKSAGGESQHNRALMVQIALTGGDVLKEELTDIARRLDPDEPEALGRMLREAVLATNRQRNMWTYGRMEIVEGSTSTCEQRVSAWAMEARSAFGVQTTSHYQNQSASKSGFAQKSMKAEKLTGELYMVVTFCVADMLMFRHLKESSAPTHKELQQAFAVLFSVQDATLISMDVVWSPDLPGEFLTEDEVLMHYPGLSKI